MKKSLLYIVLLVMTMSSCTFYKPEFRGEENVNFEKIEGNKVQLNAQAKVYNKNWFGIKIKPSKLDVYVEGDLLGQVELDKKVKMKAKRETLLQAPLTLELEKGAMMKAVGLSLKREVDVQIKGKVKAGVFIFSKKIEVDERKTISGKDLKPN